MTLRRLIRQLAASDWPVKSDHPAPHQNIPPPGEEKQAASVVAVIWQLRNNPTVRVVPTLLSVIFSSGPPRQPASPAAVGLLAQSTKLGTFRSNGK